MRQLIASRLLEVAGDGQVWLACEEPQDRRVNRDAGKDLPAIGRLTGKTEGA